MHPEWVANLHDYWRWAEEAFESCGGWLEDDYLKVEVLTEDETDPNSTPELLTVQRQRLFFADGSYLSFEFRVAFDLELLSYSFHYARESGDIVWRYDRHDGHVLEDGCDTHLHLSDGQGGERRVPYREVSPAEVLTWVRDDQAG